VEEVSGEERELLGVAEVAAYLGVGTVTVYRWCREGRLPCLKAGRSWRIRRGALDDFLSRGERPATLAGQLRGFLGVPDSVIAVAETTELLHQLDAAFMQVGEARGGLLVKFYGGEPATADELRAELERNGLDAGRLEGEGRLLFVGEDPAEARTDSLLRVVEKEAGSGRTIWAAFNWTERVDVDWAIAQQEALTELADARQLVIKTAVLERVTDAWAPGERRRAQTSHSGTISLSEAGLSLSRVTPLSSG
jgi:excisionase family DNA binding protein